MRKTFTFEDKRYSVQAKNEIELGKKIAAKIKELEDGSITINKNTTVKKWSEEWLETYKKGTVGLATYKYIETIVNNKIVSEIGTRRLKDIKSIHLQKILNDQTGNSKSYISKVKSTIRQIFSEAVANKLITDNPAERLKMPKSNDGTHRALTDKERKFILELAETHRSGLWIKVMLYCGLRPQETATLQWKDIDFKNKVIKVSTAREALTNNIKSTKSSAGVRKIPIPKPLYKSLVAAKGSPFDYVFTQPTTGNRHTKSSMRCLWTSFKYDLNIAMGTKVYRNQLQPPFAVADDLVPYCFRHTFCTDLQSAGVPINVAKELMGHEDIATTSRIYTHQSDNSLNAAADMINKFHDPKKKTVKKLKTNMRKIKVTGL